MLTAEDTRSIVERTDEYLQCEHNENMVEQESESTSIDDVCRKFISVTIEAVFPELMRSILNSAQTQELLDKGMEIMKIQGNDDDFLHWEPFRGNSGRWSLPDHPDLGTEFTRKLLNQGQRTRDSFCTTLYRVFDAGLYARLIYSEDVVIRARATYWDDDVAQTMVEWMRGTAFVPSEDSTLNRVMSVSLITGNNVEAGINNVLFDTWMRMYNGFKDYYRSQSRSTRQSTRNPAINILNAQISQAWATGVLQ